MQMVNKQGESPDLALIDDFKKGYAYVPERMAGLAKAAQQLLTSSALTQDERIRLQTSMAEMDKGLGDLQTLCRQVISALSADTLKKDASREYHSVFTGEFNDHRLSFIIFLKTMIYLKRFALEASEILHRIRSKVVGAQLAPASEFRSQFIDFRVQPAIHLCTTISTFADRMARILRVQKDPLSVKSLAGVGDYNSIGTYQLSSVFSDEQFEESGTGFSVEGPPEPLQQKRTHQPPASAGATKSPGAPQSAHYLDSTGSAAFNQGPSYVFSYDPAALEEERKGLKDVIYVDTHMGADQNFIRSDLILQYSRRSPETNSNNPEDQYTKFLLAFFDLVMDISLLNLGISAKFKNVFFYHLGPQYFYHLTRRFLFESKTGTMHRKVGASRLIQKFVPAEMTKKVILDFWRDTLLPSVGPDKDDYSAYKRVTKMVKDSYDDFGRRAMAEYDALPESARAGKNRNQIIRENLAKWLGSTNIIIFRRFLKVSS
ncbi:MAG: hypothetical protein HY042_11435 [Spirochaetia bacterium]|nr:hypothetical protein [Spirochaetia bacterium]